MNLKKYIASGVLEKYIFEIASAEEVLSVEWMIKIYPELKEELIRIEDAFELYASQHQIKPPSNWKRKFLRKLRNDH